MKSRTGIDCDDRYTIYLPNITLADSQIVNGMVSVGPFGRSALLQAVDRFGTYIQRENHYDFPSGMDAETKSKAFLFKCPRLALGPGKQKLCGAAVFQWMTQTECAEHGYFDRWWLMWVWLHPFVRGQGVLTEAWPHFRTEFGDFHAQHPLSPAMKRFLDKQGWTAHPVETRKPL